MRQPCRRLKRPAPCGLLLLTLVFILAACQPGSGEALPTVPSTAVPFPTVTPGLVVEGALTPLPPQAANPGVAPATAVALAAQPSPTPFAACPPLNPETELAEELPGSADAIRAEIARFLSAGGTLEALADGLREVWGIAGEDGFVRNDIDLTGEGLPETILGYSITGAEDAGGTLLVLRCVDRQYEIAYSYVAEQFAVPQLYNVADMNFDRRNDLLFAAEVCDDPDEATGCEYVIGLVTWSPDLGRFVSLLGVRVTSTSPPQITDVDNDNVSELVIRRGDDGDIITGPLRTGTDIYDWNGTVYVRSIVQPDPPQYRIQIIHEADRQLRAGETVVAQSLYETALDDPELNRWFRDEDDTLRAYALYRLMVVQAAQIATAPDAALQPVGLAATLQQLNEAFPDAATAPVYAAMARAFFDRWQATSEISSACTAARNIAEDDESALERLNRYGTNSPVYTIPDLCPF